MNTDYKLRPVTDEELATLPPAYRKKFAKLEVPEQAFFMHNMERLDDDARFATAKLKTAIIELVKDARADDVAWLKITMMVRHAFNCDFSISTLQRWLGASDKQAKP